MSNKHICTPKKIRQWWLEILTFLLTQFWWHCYHMFIVIITYLSHLIFLSSHWCTSKISHLIKDPFIFIICIHNSSQIYICIYMCVCVCVCVYKYIYVKSGDRNHWDLLTEKWGGIDGIIIELKCTIYAMSLKHSNIISLPWSTEKLSSTKPGAKMFGDCCVKSSVKTHHHIHMKTSHILHVVFNLTVFVSKNSHHLKVKTSKISMDQNN